MAWRGQLIRNVKELRILFSPSSPSSSSTRAFIENNYKDMKTKNPKLPILIREATGIEPQLWARYGSMLPAISLMATEREGDTPLRPLAVSETLASERGIRLEGLNEEQISKALEDLSNGGASIKC